jgi:hypothetical protein
VFDGDMVVFSAAQSGIANDAAPTLVSRLGGLRTRIAAGFRLRKWRHHVAGELSAYSVDCAHHDMLNTASLRLYGVQLKHSLE